MTVIGFDTSNYTTSAAVFTDGECRANIKLPLFVKEGERGLRQSDAVFAHTKNMPEITSRLKDALCGGKIDAVGYSCAPRDAEGSYMPCFLVGKSAAHTAADLTGAKIYPFSHQVGHISAALYSAGKSEFLINPTHFAAFHVSGGTTDILYVKSTPDGKIPLIISRLGGTLDINAGQLIDRVGVLLGLSFPCGAALEALAAEYTGERDKMTLKVNGLEASISGAENKARELYEKTGDIRRTAAFTIGVVSDMLFLMTKSLRELYPKIPIVYAGGVMSCALIKRRLSEFENVYFSSPEFSSDNAVGTAQLAYFAYKREAGYGR
ncbi:MAG: hypothetical protein LUH43_04005 [Clostridia bacterium]|nr:hypothetical protein [Clostridia bacterium]